jgi:hypothetical protein
MLRPSPIRMVEQIRQDCAYKLRSVTVDDHHQVVLGGLFGTKRTVPKIVEVVVTADGYLCGRCDGESDHEMYLGTATQFLQSIHDVAPLAQLDGDEFGFLVGKVVGLNITIAIVHNNSPSKCRDGYPNEISPLSQAVSENCARRHQGQEAAQERSGYNAGDEAAALVDQPKENGQAESRLRIKCWSPASKRFTKSGRRLCGDPLRRVSCRKGCGLLDVHLTQSRSRLILPSAV